MLRHILFFILITTITVSCASRNAVQQPSLSYNLNTQQNKVVQDGIELMAKPIHSYAELTSYYDEDTIKYGVLPVQVYVFNKSNQSFLLNLDGVNLIDGTGARVPLLSPDQTYERIKKSQWRSAGWAVATGVFAAFSIHNVAEVNKQIKADISSRFLKSGNLVPGSATEGTLFYNVPSEISSVDNWKLSLVLHDNEGKQIVATYSFSGNIEQRKTPEAMQTESEAQ